MQRSDKPQFEETESRRTLDEMLMQTSKDLYPIEDDIIRPCQHMPDESKEQLAMSLWRSKLITQISAIVLINTIVDKSGHPTGTYNNEESDGYRINSYNPSLSLSLRDNSELVFGGPLVINGAFHRNGVGFWQYKPDEE